MVAHASLPNADLHECKGASTATVGKTLVASGAGTATFKYANPHGVNSFINIATPYILTYPTAYTKATPVTTPGGVPVEYTESVDGRLTYIGVDTIVTRAIFNISLDQATGANRDLRLAIYKNGTIVSSSETIVTTTSGTKVLVTTIADFTMVTNDYVEAYIKNDGASGDVRIYTFYLSTLSMRG